MITLHYLRHIKLEQTQSPLYFYESIAMTEKKTKFLSAYVVYVDIMTKCIKCEWRQCVVGASVRLTWTARFKLTYWGRVMHICVSKLTIIASDNGLLPGWHQAIIWTKAEILLIRTLGTNFSESLCEIQTFSFKKMHLKMLSEKGNNFVSASMC